VAGAKQLFLVSGFLLTVGIAIILSISDSELQRGLVPAKGNFREAWKSVVRGIRSLFGNRILRFSLSIEFVSAMAGALVLVNTVALVKRSMHLDDAHYGLIMALFGVGGAITAFLIGNLDKTKTRAKSLIGGAFLIGIAVCFANFVSFNGLLFLWILAGVGQTLADLPSETLIGENIPTEDQAKVYGSHLPFRTCGGLLLIPLPVSWERLFPAILSIWRIDLQYCWQSLQS